MAEIFHMQGRISLRLSIHVVMNTIELEHGPVQMGNTYINI